ncbi:MAG: hypothetical protein PHR91_00345 [Candidatus Omnitrophica bacterium]|nr:hypothetical protein [Candidatus Omnitrophota bacterium]
MKNQKKLSCVTGILFLAVFFITAFYNTCVFAALDIRVRPYEGGYDLNYRNIDLQAGRVNKEVVVDITNDTGAQYRLTQVLSEPLTNDQGISMPQQSLVVYARQGSNRYGTLSVQTDTPVFFGRYVLYTSNQNGLSDSFILVYSLLVPVDQEPGYYRGRLQFILEPVNSTQESKLFVLNIAAQIEAQSKFEIITSSKDGVIRLDASNPDKKFSDVGINITGGLGKQFRITQLLPEILMSAEGDELDPESVSFIGREAKEGEVVNREQTLSVKPVTVYTSGARGQADTFVLTYSLGDLSCQKAGTYIGNIKYVLEGDGIPSGGLIDTLRLEVDNPRIFDISITPELGGRIEFRDLKPMQQPKAYEVAIKVNSNTGNRYQVSQAVASALMNKEGYEIERDYFTCRTEPLDGTKGSVKLPQKTGIRKQVDTTLFISDKHGSSDTFKAIYELTPPPDVRAGDYSTTLVYSLLEI